LLLFTNKYFEFKTRIGPTLFVSGEFLPSNSFKTWMNWLKITLAVREASFSDRNGGPIDGPLNPWNIFEYCTERFKWGPEAGHTWTSRNHSTALFERFQGALKWASTMPRDGSLSDSCKSDRWWFSVRTYTGSGASIYLFQTLVK